jgi:hypothetical protein
VGSGSEVIAGGGQEEKRPFRFRRGDPRTTAAQRKGGIVSGQVRRARIRGEVGAVLDDLSRESFHHFYTVRLGFSDPSWSTWQIVAKLFDGIPYDQLTLEEQAIYRQISGGRTTVPADLRETWLVCGRGAGKTHFEAAYAAFTASRHYDLKRGERAYIMLVAADQTQAGILFGYIHDLLHGDKDLKSLVTAWRADSLILAHGVVVQVRTGHWKKVRGPIMALFCGDEVSYWYSEETASNPDVAVLRAVRPALLKLRGRPGRMLCVTTPHLQAGATWEVYDQHFGKESPRVLVLHGDTRRFNPTISEEVIAAQVADDPLAAAEYEASWRTDLASFLNPEAILTVTDTGIIERPPEPGLSYVGFVDMSGGSRDSLALGIAHLEDDLAVLDLLRERKPPLDIAGTIEEWAPILNRYGIAAVSGDRYGAQLTVEAWARVGVSYEPYPGTMDASAYYRELIPVVNTRRCRLLDDPTLRLQLSRLIRRARRGGKDQIDHPPGGHDDVAVVAAGALVTALGLETGGRQKLFPSEWFPEEVA